MNKRYSGNLLQLIVGIVWLILVLGRPRSTSIQFARDRAHNRLDLGQLLFQVISARCLAIVLDPLRRFFDRGEQRLLILVTQLATQPRLVAQLRLETINERRERIEGFDAFTVSFIFGSKVFCLANHAFDVFLREAAFLIRNGDRLRLATAEDTLR